VTPPTSAQIKRLVGHDYGVSGASYARYAEPLVYRFLSIPLAQALGSPDGHTLDVASGTGSLGRSFRQAIAVDLAHGQLVQNPLTSRVLGDAERLPFRDSAFAAAGCAFGLAHFPDPAAAVAEMARVAPVVGLLTWARPETPFEPKSIVLATIERHAGAQRTPAGSIVDEMADRVGSENVLESLLRTAGMDAQVRTVAVEVPWPGTDAFIQYRLSLSGVSALIADPAAVMEEAAARISSLGPDALRWCPRLILGIGRRGSR
jgi:SAM-dependent methyltransferase